MLSYFSKMFLGVLLGLLLGTAAPDDQGTVLILGGQGLAGSATFTTLREASYHTTLLNNNNNYYDYHSLLSEHSDATDTIICNRPAPLSGCYELQNFIMSHGKIRAVIDFTSSSRDLMSDAVSVMGALQPQVYVFVSSAAVYDVSAEPVEAPVQEEAGVRPEGEATRDINNFHNEFGDRMLGAEEILVASGIPYVILRCGDLIGPRDTTYRWWQYQLWSQHFSLIGAPFPIPNDLNHTPFSLTYGPDVGQAVLSALKRDVKNKVYNIAMDKMFTLPHLLLELCLHFKTATECYADYTDAAETYNLYPSNHRGILSLQRAKEDLEFIPSTWDVVLPSIVEFYEGARLAFPDDRNVVLKRLNENVVPYLRVRDFNNAVIGKEEGFSVITDVESENENTEDIQEEKEDVTVKTEL